MLNRVLFALLFTVSCLACGSASAQTAPADEAQKVLDGFIDAFNSYDVDAIVEPFVDEPQFFGTNSDEPVVRKEGEKSVRAYFQNALTTNLPKTAQFEADTIDIKAVGESVISIIALDVFTSMPPGATEPVPTNGRDVITLQKAPDGRWRILNFHRSVLAKPCP